MKFLYEGSTIKKGGGRRMKQQILLTLTETEMIDRDLLVDLARQVEEEMTWKVQLEEGEDCHNLVQITEAFEKTTRREKTDRMRFAFQLRNGMEVVELASYENGVTIRQASKKDKADKLQTDKEIRVTELTVRGLKRKAFRKETVKEKADRGQVAKRALIDMPLEGRGKEGEINC